MFLYCIILLLITIQADISEGNSCVCKNPNDWQNVKPCYEMYKELSRALTRDRGNLYRMKQAFFYAPSADPVLIKVKYNISYGENVTEDQLLYCDDGLNALIAMINQTDEFMRVLEVIIPALISEMITINQTEIIRGWTSRGVYYVINPLILNKMQMVLPFAILRLINQHWRTTSGSPEVDTFLWDGSYELPTLLINLTLTSLPCIPSKEIFNCTLEELTANLKMYAKSQDSIVSSAVHADAIAYTLSEDRIMHPLNDQTDMSMYITYYCMFGYLLMIAFMLNMYISKNMKLLVAVSKKLLEHVELTVSVLFVGFLLVFSEFIAVAVFFKDITYYTTFHLYVWYITLVLVIFFIIWILYLIYKKRRAKFNFKISLLLFFLVLAFQLFLYHIYCYALPTFLLLLVYPTKVITVVAYLATFVFITSIMYSICIRIIIAFCNSRTVNRCTRVMIVIYVILFFLLPIPIFIVVIQFLYSLVLGEASAISAGPYTVLSLIPSLAISIATWLVKNKVFSSSAKMEDINRESDTTDNGEALTLAVNEETPINGNDQEVNTYGAADNN